MTAGTAIHATAILVGEAGILIRGASGSGKSTLARDLIRAARDRGLFARLVGDDRVTVSAEHGRLLARVHPRIAGLLEVRGLGLVTEEHDIAAVIRLVVDIGGTLDRLPTAEQACTELAGVWLPRMGASPGEAERVLLALRVRRPEPPAGGSCGTVERG